MIDLETRGIGAHSAAPTEVRGYGEGEIRVGVRVGVRVRVGD